MSDKQLAQEFCNAVQFTSFSHYRILHSNQKRYYYIRKGLHYGVCEKYRTNNK